jgi:hypothetical protein
VPPALSPAPCCQSDLLCCWALLQLPDEYKKSVPDTYHFMVAALEVLTGQRWPDTYEYHACPTCNQLYRNARRDLEECPECKLKYPNEPGKYKR